MKAIYIEELYSDSNIHGKIGKDCSHEAKKPGREEIEDLCHL
jgi:hypothetical protein